MNGYVGKMRINTLNYKIFWIFRQTPKSSHFTKLHDKIIVRETQMFVFIQKYLISYWISSEKLYCAMVYLILMKSLL